MVLFSAPHEKSSMSWVSKCQQAKTSPSPIFVKKKKKYCILEHGEGIQNTPLQYQNYCELKTFENQHIQEEASLHFPHLPKST